MNPDLNTVLDAAMKLPPVQRRELIVRLQIAEAPQKRGDVTKFFGTFNSGDPRSADNDKIDADLANEYFDAHEPEN